MAPSPAPGLMRAFLSISRLRSSNSKPALLILRELPRGHGSLSPWQCMISRSFSAGDDANGGDQFGKKFSQGSSGFEPQFTGKTKDGEDENGEFRLFGAGGLFGKSDERSDEWEETEELSSPWTFFAPQQQSEYREEDYQAQTWSTDGEPASPQAPPTVGEYSTDQPLQSEEGWGMEPSLATAGSADVGPQFDWMQEEDTEKTYIGTWGPDGRLVKTAYAEGDMTSQEAAFGELIRRNGYTDDDIANLMAGYYEPASLPHPDDYKYVDVEAERREKRREAELQKIAEMAKRWVKKVDEQGFAHGVGRRKTSNARVWIKEGQGRIVINKKHHDMYFVNMDDRVQYLEPFVVTDTLGMFDTYVLVRGGGTTGQAGAIRLGVSRALMWFEPSLRSTLKKVGMLTRDPRMVERKKPGKAKARKSFQWVKR